ncbi:MAG: AAA family ATPase, partial [Alphaproteobacteria bacterium]|nr:AAA family ATPase [Alphaproteobacteria bacterium]
MLTALSIRNVVLIESLDLDLAPGLTVLTGETGAGKSILLDALGLALGGRADRSLVGPWADRAQVVATFSADRAEDLARVLEGQGLDVPAGEELSLRRVLGADGRSRAFVNDQPVGRGCLEARAAPLLEIHGQRASFALLDASQHRRLLDRFGGHEAALTGTAAAFARWRAAREALETLRGRLSDTDGELAYLRAGLAEIEALAPRAGEEEELAALRARQGRAGRVSEELADALRLLGEDSGPAKRIGSALRRIERVGTEEPALMAPVLAALERTLIELQEAEGALAEAARACRYDEGALEAAEARLFALRALARKHRVTTD